MTPETSIHHRRNPHTQHLMVLQWHITERCNWRCAHCYQEGYSGEELEFKDLLNIKGQFVELLDHLNYLKSPATIRGHINISGGEPFIRHDFMDLLEVFKSDKEKYSFAILTNGSFIDSTVAKCLRELGPTFVQVSIEGTPVTNDKIRGAGAFKKTVSALKNLKQEKVPSVISFTAHRNNFLEFPEVAKLGCQLGVTRVWADRLIPEGSGADLMEQLLSPKETKDFFETMYTARGESLQSFCQTNIAMQRALQFLIGGGRPYQCAAGDRLVTVQPNGDLYPCRRMPICVGNLLQTSLLELYSNNNLFLALQDQNHISNECKDCTYVKHCRGGLKCLSYAVTGNPFNADPGCWLKKSKGDKHKQFFPSEYNKL